LTPELKAAVKELGLNSRSFAALIGVGEDTVSGWGKRYRSYRGLQKEPLWAWHLVHAWKSNRGLLLDAIARSHEALVDDPANRIFSD
jgi:hypothetical protein